MWTFVELEWHNNLNSGIVQFQSSYHVKRSTKVSWSRTLLVFISSSSGRGTFCWLLHHSPCSLTSLLSTPGPISKPSLPPWCGDGLIRAICVSRPPSLSWSKHTVFSCGWLLTCSAHAWTRSRGINTNKYTIKFKANGIHSKINKHIQRHVLL